MKKQKTDFTKTEQIAGNVSVVATECKQNSKKSRSYSKNVKNSKKMKPAKKYAALLKMIKKSFENADESCNAAENHFKYEFDDYLYQ